MDKGLYAPRKRLQPVIVVIATKCRPPKGSIPGLSKVQLRVVFGQLLCIFVHSRGQVAHGVLTRCAHTGYVAGVGMMQYLDSVCTQGLGRR